MNPSAPLEISIPSILGYEKIVSVVVACFGELVGVPPSRVEDLKTSVGEAVGNAIEHGNLLRPELMVNITVRVAQQALLVEVRDHGLKPIPDLPHPRLARGDHRGWGLDWISRLMDDVTTQARPRQNQLTMRLRISSPARF